MLFLCFIYYYIKLEPEDGERMNDQKRLETHELMAFLSRSDSLAEALEFIDDSIRQVTLAEYLNALLAQRGIPVSQLIRSANLSKAFVYQLLNGSRLAGRDAVLQVAFALSLSVEEAQRLLTVSGNSVLYPKIKRDAAIIFCLNKQLSLVRTNELLYELSLRPLGIGGE